MRFKVSNLLRDRTLTGANRRGNQVLALAVAAVLLAGCGGDDESEPKSGFLSGILPGSAASERAGPTRLETGLVFFGIAAGDEPNAVTAAEGVMKFGGTAADAAVAMALTMTVTMPSSVSLGGGGVCIVHDPNQRKTEVIDFIAPPGTPGSRGDRPSAVPTLLRGLTALHIRYGETDLRGLLAATEKKARFGHVVSRASARELALAARPLFQDPQARRIFAKPDGTPYAEGDRIVQTDLANTYAALRMHGVTAFYEGALADRMARAAQDAGGTLTREDLNSYVPRWRKPVAVPYKDLIVNFVPAPAGAGVGGGLMWNMLAVGGRFEGAVGVARAHMLLESAKRAFAARPALLESVGSDKAEQAFADPKHALSLMADFNPARATPAAQIDPPPAPVPENPAGTSFVIVDLVGLAVACNLTNYNLFGTGRVAPGTGVVLAAAPGRGDRNALSMGPVIVSEAEGSGFRFAAASSGGAAATTATAGVLATSLQQGVTLDRAIAAPRVHHGGAPDIAILEESVPADMKAALERMGHETAIVPALGRVNAAECPLGLNAVTESIACFVYADPRSAGMAAEAER